MLSPLKVNLHTATPKEGVIQNIRQNYTLGLPTLQMEPPHKGAVSVCGNAPSINETIPELTGDVWAVNGTHDYLKGLSVRVDVGFVFDPHAVMADMINMPDKDTKYYLASHCHPDLVNKLKDYDVSLFHADIGHDISEELGRLGWHAPIFGGGCGSATRAPFIAYGQGYRKIHIHGADSSFGEQTHANRNDQDKYPVKEIEITCYGRTFKTVAWMATQAKEIAKFHKAMPDAMVVVHGDGLLPHVARVHGVHYEQLKCLM